MNKLIIISLLFLTGCTCGSFNERSVIAGNTVERDGWYCSSKDMTGLHIKHGDTIIDLDNADNEAGEVISEIVEKMPASLLLP
jgi:hypothetical protein